ncbi:zinc finger protein 271-like [Achroia grisella]|uniref:zinc finger protein 271-like n=1 Tax=Achroia grisella TaxID=688607 RepID=UPI0027D2EB1D|nr:zinc finger protein 271-like [Achroia grisella]
MMFDPPDFPYKELTDSLKAHYGPDDLIFNTNDHLSDINRDLVTVTEQMITNVENELSFHSNDAGKHFNVESTATRFSNIDIADSNMQMFIVQTDNLINYEPTLLDENTVNQFLLPIQSIAENKDLDNQQSQDLNTNGPDILALHSCVICHDIFTSDSDLLDHTISFHASNTTVNQNNLAIIDNSNEKEILAIDDPKNSAVDLEADWLVCSTCERVLSTALEIEPSEQLCCVNSNGKGNVSSRKLITMYVCEFCNGLFADGEALDRHRLSCFNVEEQNYYLEQLVEGDSLIHNNQNTYCNCEYCGKDFSSAEDLKLHQAQCPKPPATRNIRRTYTNNNNNKMWNCGSCNQLFATARELYRHKRGEDRSPGAPLTAYVCEECDKVLGSMCALHTHKKMHKVSKPGYPCRICGRRFNQSGHLAIHMRMHTGERPYPCDLCPKAFKVKVERDDHRRTHTGERPFACAACPKTFTAAARLREHARIHTDQRPYRCDICGAAFRRPYARTVHTLIHTGEKPHECDVCGTAFRRSGDMWKHKRTLHGVQGVTDTEFRKS